MNDRNERYIDSGKRIQVENISGEEIPQRSFAVLSYNAVTGYRADKPDADSITPARLVVVISPIPIGGTGYAVFPENGKVWVTHDGTSPDAGDSFGTVADQWYGSNSSTGFKCACASGGRACVSPFSGAVNFHKFHTGALTKSGLSISGSGTLYTDWVSFTEYDFHVFGGSLVMLVARGADYDGNVVISLSPITSIGSLIISIQLGYDSYIVADFVAANIYAEYVRFYSPLLANCTGMIDPVTANKIRLKATISSGDMTNATLSLNTIGGDPPSFTMMSADIFFPPS